MAERSIPLNDWWEDIKKSNLWFATPRQEYQSIALLKGGVKLEKMEESHEPTAEEVVEEVIVEDKDWSPMGENPFNQEDLNFFMGGI